MKLDIKILGLIAVIASQGVSAVTVESLTGMRWETDDSLSGTFDVLYENGTTSSSTNGSDQHYSYDYRTRLDSTLGAFTQVQGSSQLGEFIALEGSADSRRRYVLDMGSDNVQFGDWSIKLGYDGTASVSGEGEVSYSLQAAVYMDSAASRPDFRRFLPVGGGSHLANFSDSGSLDSSSPSTSLDLSGSEAFLNFNLDEFIYGGSSFYDSMVVELAITASSSVNAYNGRSGAATADFLNTFAITGVTGAGANNATNLGVTPVPVPPAVWLLGSGFLGFVGFKRFRLMGLGN